MRRSAASVNRAPVLTLWGAVVAQRMGCDQEAALTPGRRGWGQKGELGLDLIRSPDPDA